MPDAFAREFLRALLTLREYMQNIVLIGGCVPYVYSQHMFDKRVKQAPVYTKDLDLLVENQVPLAENSIVSLMQAAGYACRALESRHTQYFKFESGAGTGFEIEFMTPAPDKGYGDTVIVQSGLRAQVIPGLELFLSHNTEVRIVDELDGTAVDIAVRVPTPGAFVLNKLQTYLEPLGDRGRTKDLYYAFYVMRSLTIDKEAIVESMRECASNQALESLGNELQTLFYDEYSDGTRDVAMQLTGLDLSAHDKRLLVKLEMSEFARLLMPSQS